MYIKQTRTGYNRDGEQFSGPGHFLIFLQGEADDCQGKIKAVVRQVRLKQMGHWMMGRASIGGYKVTLSGSYGHDGLPLTVCNRLYREAGLFLPDDLYQKWNKGGGWNSAGSEAADVRQWALENIKALIKSPKLPRLGADIPNLDGMDSDDLRAFDRRLYREPLSIADEMLQNRSDAVEIISHLRSIASASLQARALRLSGNIPAALSYESVAETHYRSIPESMRW